MMSDTFPMTIRIGTMVTCGMKSPEYIRQILPHGFESFCLSFWRTTKGIDWHRLADQIGSVLDGTGAVVSCIDMFGNPLGDEPLDRESLDGWQQCIDNAHLFGCSLLGGFTGRVRGRAIHDSIARFKEVWSDLGRRAADKGLRIGFENCSMGGTWATGDWNIAHNPKAWELMFDAVPLENLGLEWEPCHQLTYLIDPLPQLRQWVAKVFHVHGKDATVRWDIVRTHGVYSSMAPDVALPAHVTPVPPFAYHRSPGFGDSNWTDIITELRLAGYRGSIDIEGWHDPVYKGELEMTGQVHALNYLKRCRGGAFVANPVV